MGRGSAWRAHSRGRRVGGGPQPPRRSHVSATRSSCIWRKEGLTRGQKPFARRRQRGWAARTLWMASNTTAQAGCPHTPGPAAALAVFSAGAGTPVSFGPRTGAAPGSSRAGAWRRESGAARRHTSLRHPPAKQLLRRAHRTQSAMNIGSVLHTAAHEAEEVCAACGAGRHRVASAPGKGARRHVPCFRERDCVVYCGRFFTGDSLGKRRLPRHGSARPALPPKPRSGRRRTWPSSSRRWPSCATRNLCWRACPSS